MGNVSKLKSRTSKTKTCLKGYKAWLQECFTESIDEGTDYHFAKLAYDGVVVLSGQSSIKQKFLGLMIKCGSRLGFEMGGL